MKKAVEISGVRKKYANGPEALKGIDLEINEGEFFALLGANGAGKTTLIGIMTGLVTKTTGEVKIFGYDIDKEHNEAKRLVGVVPQEFNFNIFEKVIDIVCTQGGYFGMTRVECLEKAEQILKQLDLWEKKDVIAMQLSGGMKRRLMIARSLIHSPKLLLLDEPTAGVDVELRYETWEYIKGLNRDGMTIVLTTHYLEEVEQLCRKVAIIKKGEIVANDSVKTLVNSLDSQIYVLTVNKVKGSESLVDYSVTPVDESTLEVVVKSSDSLTKLAKELEKQAIEILDVRPKSNRMDQLFLNLLKQE